MDFKLAYNLQVFSTPADVVEGGSGLNEVVNFIAFAIPGVIIGEQIGPTLQKNITRG